MAKFQFKGVDELVRQYEKLESNTDKIIGEAVYNGANVVMGYIEGAVDGLSTDNHFGTAEKPTSGPSTIQKLGLQHSLGIAKMQNDHGFRNVKIGFDGYNNVKTKTWPQGQPNLMVARAIESGTSWMQKQPFMRKAEQSARGPCEAIMSEIVDMEIRKLVK